jgi:hypothetical protein
MQLKFKIYSIKIYFAKKEETQREIAENVPGERTKTDAAWKDRPKKRTFFLFLRVYLPTYLYSALQTAVNSFRS